MASALRTTGRSNTTTYRWVMAESWMLTRPPTATSVAWRTRPSEPITLYCTLRPQPGK